VAKSSVQRAQRKRAGKLSGYWTQKFTKFLSDVEVSLAVLTRTSVSRSSHSLWNASAQRMALFAWS